MKKTFKILKQIFIVLIFVFSVFTILRFFAFDMYLVPSESMIPTIKPGEYIFIDKLALGARWFKKEEVSRIPALGSVKRNDIIVFNFPEGDTIYVDEPFQNYYFFQRLMAAGKKVNQRIVSGEKCYLPIANRIAYVKRCVALPGDTLKIKDTQLYINGIPQKDVFNYMRKYKINGNTAQVTKALRNANINQFRIKSNKKPYVVTRAFPEEIKNWKKEHLEFKVNQIYNHGKAINIFPLYADKYKNWSGDKYGPLYIPKAGDTIILNSNNYPIYSRLIEVYEGNKLERINSFYYINNVKTNKYVIKQNYYFMMGDNRYASMDSRKWGFVPEDHLIGKAKIVISNKSKEGQKSWSQILRFLQ